MSGKRRREPGDKELTLDEILAQPSVVPERKILLNRGLNADEMFGDTGFRPHFDTQYKIASHS